MSSDRELLNELKRLQSVITSLDAMIAQQIITNTNLANSITELQNQVAQQVITNTNLVAQQVITNNMLVELQASVVTLAAITGQLVTVNTRALDNTDLANEPLPYNFSATLATNTLAIAHNDFQLIQLSAADWGVGQDYYVTQIVVEYIFTNLQYFRYWHGMELYIFENEGGARPEIFSHTFNPLTDPAIRVSENGVGHLLRTFPIRTTRVDATSTIDARLYNFCGVQIVANNILVRFLGMVI